MIKILRISHFPLPSSPLISMKDTNPRNSRANVTVVLLNVMHANDPVALNTDIKEKKRKGKRRKEMKERTKGKRKEKKKENEANYYDEILLPYKRVPYPKAG